MASLVRPSLVAQVLAGARPRVHNVWRHISASAAGVGSRRGVAWQPLACSSWRQFSVVTAASETQREAHLKIENQRFILSLDVDGEPRQFRFRLGESAGVAAASIASEAGVADVHMLDDAGDPVPTDSLLLEVARRPLSLVIGEQQLPVSACKGTVGHASADEHRVHLQVLMRKANYMRVRKILESDTRRQIKFSEFLDICKANGVAAQEATELCRKLHDVGVILHFSNSKLVDIKETVFLKPEEVTDSVFAEFGLTSPTQLFVSEQSRKKRAQLEDMSQELETLQSLKTSLDEAAERTAQRASWLGFGALLGGCGYFAYLTYVEFSWDIMEPVTYFTGSFFGIVGFVWWHLASSDFEYANLRDLVLQRKLRKSYAEYSFDLERYNDVAARVQRLRNEVAALDLTHYNPALISAYLSRHHIDDDDVLLGGSSSSSKSGSSGKQSNE